jgi:Ca-activated chloride channel homolog
LNGFFRDITFANPEYFWLFILPVLMLGWYVFRHEYRNADMKISSVEKFMGSGFSAKVAFRHGLFAFRILAIGLIIIALARPQSRSSWKNVSTQGIDIILSMDISASMLAQDFKPNRIEVSKEVAMDFIDMRPNDRIGLVIFSGESFTQCPITTDHAIIKNMFAGIRTGMVEDGTAIGMGLATAVGRIKTSDAKSKVVILLTDGVNNSGAISPETAAEIAKTFGIRVYTIGVGTMGKAYSPVALFPNGQYEFDFVDVKIDEPMLTRIAEQTGGRYFRATNKEKLKDIYREIDKLEKTKIEEKSFTNKAECFLPFALAAAVLLMLEFAFKNTLFRTIP